MLMIVLHEKNYQDQISRNLSIEFNIQMLFCIYAWAIGPSEEEIQTNSMTFSVQDENKKLFSHSEKI